MKDIKVSIVCATFNHEKYIREAIDSFLMQETDFRFEIIIHDDASTDRTPEIIKEYSIKYPDVIVPILQKENMYSRKIPIYQNFIFPIIRGTYIASCEGDDYWTDKHKLQREVEALDKHTELDICAHGAMIVYANTKEIKGYIAPTNKETVLSLDEVILGGGGYVSTNSLMYRFSIDSDIPAFRRFTNDDYAKQIHGSLRGGMYYIPEIMSAYRYLSDNSWTRSMSMDLEKRKQEKDRIIEFLNMVDSHTNHKNAETIEKRKKIEEAIVLELENRCREILNKEYRLAWESYSLNHKMKIIIKSLFPFLYEMKHKNRGKI